MADDFFSDDFNDPFDSIVSRFFGSPQRRIKKRYSMGEDDESEIGFIETDDSVFLILELPGYKEKEIVVNIKNRVIEIQAIKQNLENVKDYLAQKLQSGASITRTLPVYVNSKKFSHTFKNGVLEVRFDKR